MKKRKTKEHKSHAIILLGIVGIIAIIGLIMMFTQQQKVGRAGESPVTVPPALEQTRHFDNLEQYFKFRDELNKDCNIVPDGEGFVEIKIFIGGEYFGKLYVTRDATGCRFAESLELFDAIILLKEMEAKSSTKTSTEPTQTQEHPDKVENMSTSKIICEPSNTFDSEAELNSYITDLRYTDSILPDGTETCMFKGCLNVCIIENGVAVHKGTVESNCELEIWNNITRWKIVFTPSVYCPPIV